MIAASRRRRPGVISADEAFRLHRRMARRASWSTRLMRAALLSLVASLVALLFGAGLTAHLAALLAAFALGLTLPVPGSERSALAEIRAVAGLAYETALGLVGGHGGAAAPAGRAGPGEAPPAAERPDPYGFEAAVIDRARLSVSDIRPASPPAWWLPAVAVAVALLLFGVLERPFANGAGGGTGGVAGPSGGNAPTAVAEDDSEEPAPPDIAPPEAGRAQEPEGADGPTPGEEPEGPDVAPPAEGGDPAAPMSRFLDSLRERPREQGGAGNPGEPNVDDADQPGEGANPQNQAGGGQGEGQGEPERTEVQRGGSPSGERSQGDAAGEQAEAEGEGAGEAGGEAGEEAGGEEGAGGAGEDGSQEQVPGGEQPQEGAGEAPAGQPGAESDQGQSELEAGGAEGDSSDPLDEGGAGFGAGAEQEAGVAEGQGTPPEFLQGVLEEGPENPGGTVRLPGDETVTLPPGRSPADYQSAAEEALTEGDLPLSYQEIIRRYFR